ncbi:MAG: hypothetical protein ABJF10_23705 [Chthoniobacter sp.]|uniref:hypothetical protein n=1 Tax=Chthoniobacter sp. TaxID=2510640 RepID=UPI0032A59078
MASKKLPARLVTDYSVEELAAFREAFQPLAQRFRRRSQLCWYATIPALLFYFLWVWLPEPFSTVALWLTGGFGLFALVNAPFLPRCPACQAGLNADGPYCPMCGKRSLRSRGILLSPECDSCGRRMRRSNAGTRLYRIRACSHCGVMLDDEGLGH